MKTNFAPGQILYIQSVENFFYISVMRSMQPHPAVDDEDRYEINTCCDLCVDVYGEEMYPAEITFARGGNSSTWDLDVEFDEIRPAHDFEKKLLFDRLVEKFKLYDPKWKQHFTDSSYFDILNWLAWTFDVDLDDEANTDTPLGEAISEIQKYIWDALCKETNNYQEKTAEPEMVNKQEFIEKVRNWLEKHTYDDKYWTSDGEDLFVGNLIDDICKYLEE